MKKVRIVSTANSAGFGGYIISNGNSIQKESVGRQKYQIRVYLISGKQSRKSLNILDK